MLAIGSDREDVGPTPDIIKDARDAVAQLVGATLTDPLQSEIHNCTLCADLLSAWARFSGDPDTDVVSWLTEGTPAGIVEHPFHVGISDAVGRPDFTDPADGAFGDPASRVSYASVEEDEPSANSIDSSLLGSSRSSRRWICAPSFSVALLWCPNS